MIKIFNTHKHDFKDATINCKKHNRYIRESLVEVKNIEMKEFLFTEVQTIGNIVG